MPDPFTTLSVAAAIVQFVDFSSNVVKKARQIHQTGSDRNSRRHAQQARDIKNVADHLEETMMSDGPHLGQVEQAKLDHEEAALSRMTNTFLTLGENLETIERPHLFQASKTLIQEEVCTPIYIEITFW